MISLLSYKSFSLVILHIIIYLYGLGSSVAERQVENLQVGGSNPPLGIVLFLSKLILLLATLNLINNAKFLKIIVSYNLRKHLSVRHRLDELVNLSVYWYPLFKRSSYVGLVWKSNWKL